MNAEEFVRYAKTHAIDGSVDSIVRELTAPRTFVVSGTASSWIEQQQASSKKRSEWFANLGAEGQQQVRDLLQECSEMTLLNLFSLIDGVGGEYEGVFEITAVDEINRTLVNPENTEMLHDILSEVISETKN